MVKRLMRLIVATASFALIAVFYQPSVVQGQHPCYACITSCGGHNQIACNESCGGAGAGACFGDIYGFCEGTSDIVECGGVA